LNDPLGTAIRWRTALLDGSMRDKAPSLVATHTLSGLAVIPPSEFCGWIGSAVTLLVDGSMRSSDGCSPHTGDQRLPKAYTNPEHGSPSTVTLATMRFVRASMRCTA
jgi:hypothetical protein